MSESFLKPFEYMYEESDRVIERGMNIPEVNQHGNTPAEIIEQIPVEVPKLVFNPILPPEPPVIVSQPTTQQDKRSPEAVTSVPTVVEQPIPSPEPTTSDPPIEPEPTTTVPKNTTVPTKGRNISVAVDDSLVAKDR